MSVCKLSLAAAVAMLAGTVQTPAQTTQVVAQSGKPQVIAIFFDCTAHFLPNVSAGASHGTVTVDKSTRDGPCGNKGEPVVTLTYTSETGFKGLDGVNIFVAGGQNESFTIQVR